MVVVRDGDNYMAGLFSNYLKTGERAYVNSLSDLYKIYGITSADGIKEISVAKAIVSETEVIKNFYEMTGEMKTWFKNYLPERSR